MKHSTPYQIAIETAAAFLDPLASACDRIEIAGSLRRKQDTVGDIEIVCIPKMIQSKTTDLFGLSMEINLLEERLRCLRAFKPNAKQVQIDLGTINIDLFIVTPETWGVQFMIRTGSADFSKWMVTKRQQGGALPSHLQVKDGRIWSGGLPLETPEEADVFRVCGLDWIAPEMRIGGRWKR